ncbi:MAG TPA: ferritin-like protein [Kamptonema sp.]|nr:ferritin-like protein [Kamptonema sp.]
MTTDNNYQVIETVKDLHYYLVQAMKLEHATIPPYITALYSLKPGTNLEAFHIIRAVAVEEMLHLTLVANVFNAVGGKFFNEVEGKIEPTLTADDFIPHYPTALPTGETDFEVSLSKFSPETVDTFIKIERTEESAPKDQPLVVSRPLKENLLRVRGEDKSLTFYSIGLFYAEIIRGLYALHKEMGDKLFCGDPKRQITPEYYYNGGGDIIPVTDLRSAIRALKVIQEQGEGSRSEAIYDAERELSHYYRFQQLIPPLLNGKEQPPRYYIVNKDDPEKSDLPGSPTGECFTVDWDAVYPLKTNATLSDYPKGSEVYVAAKDFQSSYHKFLKEIEESFDGHPEKLIPAVGGMFRLKEQASHLIRNPIPGMNGVNAAPIFRLD